MSDIIFTSIKKILTDANLPLILKFDNDESEITEVKAKYGADYPEGTTEVILVDKDSGESLSGVSGKTFQDIYGNTITIVAYNETTSVATLNSGLNVDVVESEVVKLKQGDELKLIQLASTYSTAKQSSPKSRYRIKGFDVVLTSLNDVSGDKVEGLATKVLNTISYDGKIYKTYDENGNRILGQFQLETPISFTDISTDVNSKVLVGRVRYSIREDVCN